MKYFYLLILICMLFSGAAAVSAAGTSGLDCSGSGGCKYVPLEPLPIEAGAQNGTDFPVFVSGVFKILITFGGLLAVVMLVVAGIGYMLSESAVDIDRAKDRAKAALWGLVILMGSWLVLNTINPDLLKFNIFDSSLTKMGGLMQAPSPQNSSAPTALPEGTVGGGTVDGAVQTAVCGTAATCDTKKDYVTYDFGTLTTPSVKAKIDAFTTACQAPILDTQRNINRIGSVVPFSGSVVGGSSLTTGLACVLN